MNNDLIFLFKIAVISTLISILVKYGGRLLPVSPNTTIALIAISLPSIILVTILGWRYSKS